MKGLSKDCVAEEALVKLAAMLIDWALVLAPSEEIMPWINALKWSML